MTTTKYPGVADRVKAVVVDSVVTVLLMFLATFIFSYFEEVPDSVRLSAFIFIFGLYDPIFTSFFGGTIGHMVMGLKVKRKSNPEKNILLPFALIRFIVKAMLGIVSLFTVSTTEKRNAIHDYAGGSVVLYR